MAKIFFLTTIICGTGWGVAHFLLMTMRSLSDRRKIDRSRHGGLRHDRNANGKGFGVFVPEALEIYIAGEMPEKEENLIKVLAHEFKHFLQYREEKPFDEAEADAFAEEIYKKAKRQQEKTKARKQIEECIEACIDCDGIATINKNCSNCGVMSKLRDAGIRAREERQKIRQE